MEVALVQHQHDLVQLAVHYFAENRRRRRRRRRLEVWVKAWIGRRHQFGLYNQLMVELRNEDQRSFRNVLLMEPGMFDELLERVGPRIMKQHTRYRAPHGAWPEACTDFATPCLWEQLFYNAVWVEDAS